MASWGRLRRGDSHNSKSATGWNKLSPKWPKYLPINRLNFAFAFAAILPCLIDLEAWSATRVDPVLSAQPRGSRGWPSARLLFVFVRNFHQDGGCYEAQSSLGVVVSFSLTLECDYSLPKGILRYPNFPLSEYAIVTSQLRHCPGNCSTTNGRPKQVSPNRLVRRVSFVTQYDGRRLCCAVLLSLLLYLFLVKATIRAKTVETLEQSEYSSYAALKQFWAGGRGCFNAFWRGL